MRPAPRHPQAPPLRLIADPRIPTCIVRGEYTLATLDSWLLTAQIQRPLDARRVAALAEQIRRTHRVPGMFGVGTYRGGRYLLDGRHRREAVRRSGLQSVSATIAWMVCKMG